jgi:arylsulfatase A-like enzyme
VPFLLRYPARLGKEGREIDAFIDAPDIMPTLLGLADLPIPKTVQGLDFTAHIEGGPDPTDGAVVVACHHPFGQWRRGEDGPPHMTGREYRGVRTKRYTYCRSLEGPWLLYNNEADPYQLDNLIGNPATANAQAELDALLNRKLEAMGDAFLPGGEYLRQWGYSVDATGTVPYAP